MYKCGYCGDYHADNEPCPVQEHDELMEMHDIAERAIEQATTKPRTQYMRQWREKNKDRVRAYTREQVRRWRAIQ